MPAAPRPLSRPVRFFFMNLGTLVGIIVYFHLAGPIVPYSHADVTHALRTALVVHTVYMAIARWLGEMKQFDVSLWLLLQFQWPHALGQAFVFWGIMILFVMPPVLTRAENVAKERAAARAQVE